MFAIHAILENKEYTKAMGFQLLYWHYLKSINHPFLKVLDESPQSFVGEDIELSLMLLSNYTSTTPLTRDNKDASASYKKLSLLAEIAKNVRDYKISRFGGYTEERAPLSYSLSSPEVTAATNFVRNFIEKTEESGLYTYKLEGKKQLIAKRKKAHESAKRYKNVPHIDLIWTSFAETMITRHLQAFVSPPFKVATHFDKAFLSSFVDRYSFDETSLELFPDEENQSDSSSDDLPLNSEEWRTKMSADIPTDYCDEKGRTKDKRYAQQKQRAKNSEPQIPTNKRHSAQNSVQASSVPQSTAQIPAPVPSTKRGPGRPPGSRNKKTLARLGILSAAESHPKAKAKRKRRSSIKRAGRPGAMQTRYFVFHFHLMFAISAILTSSIQHPLKSPISSRRRLLSCLKRLNNNKLFLNCF